MPAYFVANVRVSDPKAFAEYAAQTPAVIARYGGRFLARGGQVGFTEGAWTPDRFVVVEFPTMEALQRWYNSEEYQRLLQVRKRSATTDAVAVSGV